MKMEWNFFHHPDICVPVIARRTAEEVLDLLIGMGVVALTRGWALAAGSLFASNTAFICARRRLEKKGLLAYQRRRSGGLPTLTLTDAALNSMPDEYWPEKRWSKSWNGRWYLLIYDVPEKARAYRNTLRNFIKSLRMGCLQRSVWISPFDIRPEYDDLKRAAEIEQVAFLFESQTVLGLSPDVLVETAWDLQTLREMQMDYCNSCAEVLNAMQAAKWDKERAAEFWREEVSAYRTVMERDPLLPRELWPKDYLGPKVYAYHHEARQAIHQIMAG